MSDYPHITYKKHTFLSSLALGTSAFAITLIISCTVVVIYGMHFVGDRSDKVISSVDAAIRGLPELHASLPPVVADILDDHRQPDYHDQLAITARVSPLEDHGRRMRTVIEIVNNGDEIVSLLSLRVVVLDSDDNVLAESNEWAATPIAFEDEWRGPLMPGSRRRFVSFAHRRSHASALNNLKAEVEITDIRIWNGPPEISVANNE